MVETSLDFTPPVSAVQSWSSWEGESDLLPLTPKLFKLLQQNNVVLGCPCSSIDVGIQSFAPPLCALIVRSSLDTLCDFTPLTLELLNACPEQVILFLCPRALFQTGVERMEPALSTVFVGPARDTCGDFGPLFGLVSVCLDGGAQELVLFRCPDNPFAPISLSGRQLISCSQQLVHVCIPGESE